MYKYWDKVKIIVEGFYNGCHGKLTRVWGHDGAMNIYVVRVDDSLDLQLNEDQFTLVDVQESEFVVINEQ